MAARVGALIKPLTTRWFQAPRPLPEPPQLPPRFDVLTAYAFVNRVPVGKPLVPGQAGANSINWFVPIWQSGSGGLLNIFRLINHLGDEGFDSRIVIVGAPASMTSQSVADRISEQYFPVKAGVYVGAAVAPAARFSVATLWTTAYTVRNFLSTEHKCYFVQDFEPWFYPAGTEYALAEDTYRFGFFGITAGRWLSEKLASEYGMRTVAMGFSAEARYRPMSVSKQEGYRIFFYARPSTPRRGFELGLMALRQVAERLPGMQVVCAGEDISRYEVPFDHVNAGNLQLDELPGVYNECDAALILSFSNASLLPLEVMACGTPVVCNRGANNEWLVGHDNCFLAAPTVDDLAAALCQVLQDRSLREGLRKQGLALAASTSWAEEARHVGRALRQLGSTSTGGWCKPPA